MKSQTTNHDIQIGDVFRSNAGGRLVTVVPRSEYEKHRLAHYWNLPTIDSRDVFYRGKTGAVMVALAANFLKGRRLVERGGIRVGDVRGCGTSGSRSTVVQFREGGAICRVSFSSDLSNEWFPLDFLSTLPLLERDGKAV